MNKVKLFQLFEGLYKDAKNNVMWMEKFIEGYTSITNNLHCLYDNYNIPHDDTAMANFETILKAARCKVARTRDLIYSVEHPEENES